MRLNSILIPLLSVSLAHAAAPDLSEKFFDNSSSVIVFFGDSITNAGGYIKALQALVAKKYPGAKASFVNRGLSSETVAGLTEQVHPGPRPLLFNRLANELKTYKPNLIFACYGMNDGIYAPFGEERFKPYRDGIQKLLDEAAKTGVPVILLSPPPFDSLGAKSILHDAAPYGYQTPYRNYDSVLTAYSHWVAGLDGPAQKAVNIHDYVKAAIVAKRKQDANFKYSADGIHPADQGHQWMAEAVFAGLFEEPAGMRPVLPSGGRGGIFYDAAEVFDIRGATLPVPARAGGMRLFARPNPTHP